MKHATEPDHLAAVVTLAFGRQTLPQAIRQGAAWGVGHTVTLMLFGGVVLAMGKSVPPLVEQGLELAVGLMLLGLGVDVLRRLRWQTIHFHVHHHAPDLKHILAHAHGDAPPAAPSHHVLQSHDHPHGLPLRALTIGMMHGLAGSAALILLSLEAVESLATGLIYIAVFGLGSLVGMGVLSVAIAVPLRFSALGRLTWLHQGIAATVGGLSCLLGGTMVYHSAMAAGMFF